MNKLSLLLTAFNNANQSVKRLVRSCIYSYNNALIHQMEKLKKRNATIQSLSALNEPLPESFVKSVDNELEATKASCLKFIRIRQLINNSEN